MMLQCIQQTFNTHNTKYELLIVSSAIMSAYNIHFNSFTKWCSWKGRVIIIIFLKKALILNAQTLHCITNTKINVPSFLIHGTQRQRENNYRELWSLRSCQHWGGKEKDRGKTLSTLEQTSCNSSDLSTENED